MQYKFKNRTMTKLPEKLVIVLINLLVSYQMMKIDYAEFFLISKLIILNIKFEVSRVTSFANNRPAKFGRKTRLGQCVLR